MTVALRIDDFSGNATQVTAEEGDTVLDALLMEGIAFPYSCQSGNCGTCRCELVSGDVLELERSEHALSEADRMRGVILACRTQLWSDTHVSRLSEDDFVVHPSRVLQCRLAAGERLAGGKWRVTLNILSGGPFDFSAGQYADLEFAGVPGRPITCAMANGEGQDTLEFHVTSRRADVPGAPDFETMEVGRAVTVSGPRGGAYLRTSHSAPIVLIVSAAGVGSAVSILSTLRHKGLRNEVHGYLVLNHDEDAYGVDELGAAAAGNERVKLHVLNPSGHGAGQFPVRQLSPALAMGADFADMTGIMAYIAGPTSLYEELAPVLRALGVRGRDILCDVPAQGDAGAVASREAA